MKNIMKIFPQIISALILLVVVIGCFNKKKEVLYDVILVIGQSNTHTGFGLDSNIDTPSNFIKQLGRFDANNYKVIPAIEPLEHHYIQENCVGSAMTFAKSYVHQFLMPNRKILLIPSARGGSGFLNKRWNKGNDLYKDALQRTLFVLDHFSNSKLVAILWHQGEADIANKNFKVNLDSFIINIRHDIGQDSVPFILGGMVPYWFNQSKDRVVIQEILKDTPNRIFLTAFADSEVPFPIEKENNERNAIHFDAKGLRELGRRYFNEYKKIRVAREGVEPSTSGL